jgi:hypothetical protein
VDPGVLVGSKVFLPQAAADLYVAMSVEQCDRQSNVQIVRTRMGQVGFGQACSIVALGAEMAIDEERWHEPADNAQIVEVSPQGDGYCQASCFDLKCLLRGVARTVTGLVNACHARAVLCREAGARPLWHVLADVANPDRPEPAIRMEARQPLAGPKRLRGPRGR